MTQLLWDALKKKLHLESDMKIYLSVFLSIGTLFTSAQGLDILKVYDNEVSVNATGFVANYFNLGGVSSNSPYIIDYKRRISGNNTFLRSSLNLAISDQNNESPNGSRIKQKANAYDLRLGLEWRKQIANKFIWSYGIDAAAGLGNNYSSSEFVFNNFFNGRQFQDTILSIAESSTVQIGGGPVTGLRWQVSPRISVWTESRLYFFYAEDRNETRFEDVMDETKLSRPGQFDGNSRVNFSNTLNLFAPLDLYITFHF